jgi:hypothetical protein
MSELKLRPPKHLFVVTRRWVYARERFFDSVAGRPARALRKVTLDRRDEVQNRLVTPLRMTAKDHSITRIANRAPRDVD